MLLLASGCSQKNSQQIVIYTSVDRHLAQPIFQQFEAHTGTTVLAVFDSEANKTVGLYQRLISERGHPRADVFWNSEILHTRLLAQKGIIDALPTLVSAQFVDSDSNPTHWRDVAIRARALVLNHQISETANAPWSLFLLTDPRFKNKAGIANPRYGTTKTHFAYLLQHWGDERFRHWLELLKHNGVVLLPGNAQVRDYVARGTLLIGLTDTDDVISGIQHNLPISLFLPKTNHADDEPTLLIPSTVSVVTQRPHPELAQKFVAFLASKEAVLTLTSGSGGFLPPTAQEGDSSIISGDQIKQIQPDWAALEQQVPLMLKIFDDVWFAEGARDAH
jgi:iron(III) transport system substrate-binding protein